MKKISVIITAYNRLPALQAVIQSLAKQTYNGEIEIIVADDGSTKETIDWLQQQTIFPSMLHIWQPDEGFRAAAIRNQAAAKASGDYLIFIDGDCVTPTFFLKNHAKLAEKNYFVSGNRVLLSPAFTEQVLNQHLDISHWTYLNWLFARMQGKCNRAQPFCPLWRFVLPYQYSHKWEGAKTCNLALWREDFIAANGFDEHYQGWGYEDSDLVIRLMRTGIKRKHSRFSVPVLHLWHRENDRSQEENNRLFLERVINSDRVLSDKGISQYL
jgi:glycosyltransferase involved in cell wall biosynthesis